MRHVFEFEGDLFEREQDEDLETENWSNLGDSVQISGHGFALQGDVECSDDGVYGELDRESFVIGTDHKLDRVTFHLPNYPNPGGGNPIQSDDAEYNIHHLSEIRLEAQGWRIRIQPLKEIQQLDWAADASYGSVINAVGEITKQELVQFKPVAAKKLLDALHYFLSFAFLEWTPPLFVVGSNEVRDRSWQYFKNYPLRRVRFAGLKGWLSISGVDHLSVAFQGFLKKWSDAIWCDSLRSAINWLVESSVQKDRDVRAAITLAQIPFEMLAWMVFVDEKEIIIKDEFDKLSAASKLQLLLSHCSIDFQVPDSLKALKLIANNTKQNTGPKIITKVRNTIIHPSKSNREQLESWSSKYSISLNAVYDETFELYEHYLTLIVLFLIDYNGPFRNRLGSANYEDFLTSLQGSPVPWAKDTSES